MKLITDTYDFGKVKLLTESSDNGHLNGYYMTGIYAQSDVKNGNNRIYPYEELKRAIDEFRTEMIETNRAGQEMEHPENTVINYDRVCARILSLEEDNGAWVGKSVVLASIPEKGIKGTVCGDLVASLLTYGTQLGQSTRAVGEVNESGEVHDMKLVTIDVVSNPSIGIFNTSNANRFVNGILESKEFILDNHGDIIESLEPVYNKFNKKLKKMPKTSVSSKKADYLGAAVTDFLNSIIG